MKAIILERRGEMAAVLREDGTFENRRVEGAVGETVELDGKVVAFPNKRKSRWLRTAVAAVLVLSITSGTLGYMGGTASAYVSLEVEDAAIELTVNHFGRVIEVSALSEDTAELADELRGELRHRRPEDALDITMEHLRERGYLKREDAEVFAGVTSDSAARKAELKQAVERSVQSDDRPVHVSETSRAERREAMERHVSPGRFGFERDHGALPDEAKEPAEAEETKPAVPAMEAIEEPAEQETPPAPANEERGEPPAEGRQGGALPDEAKEPAETEETKPAAPAMEAIEEPAEQETPPAPANEERGEPPMEDGQGGAVPQALEAEPPAGLPNEQAPADAPPERAAVPDPRGAGEQTFAAMEFVPFDR